MGLEAMVPLEGPCPLAPVLERLAAAGLPTTVVMVDGTLQAPAAPLPDAWREVRLKTPAGMVTLARRPSAVAVVVFGNASAELQQAQRAVADALRAPDPGR